MLRVLFCALLLAGAVVVVYLRPSGGGATGAAASPPATEPPRAAPRVVPMAPPRFAREVTIAPPATDAYRGVVIDGTTGEPVEDAQVMLCRGIKDGDPVCADAIASVDTDETGQFEIEKPDEAVGALVVDVDEYAAAVVTSPSARSLIELWPGGRVIGYVVDSKGEPVGGANVGWMLPGAELRLATDDTSGEETGMFVLDRLPPGQVIVYAIADHRTAIARLTLGRGDHREVQLVLDDAEPLHVRGVVQDRLARPLAFVQITVEPRSDLLAPDPDALLAAEQTRHLGTDIDGEFEIDFRTPGPHRLTFWAWNRETGDVLAEAQVTASADPKAIKIPIWDPNVVVCTLADDAGAPEPFTQYSYTYSMADDEENGGYIGMGGISTCGGCGGPKGHDQLAFVWPRRVSSIEITLEGQSAEGSVTLRGPRDSCAIRGTR